MNLLKQGGCNLLLNVRVNTTSIEHDFDTCRQLIWMVKKESNWMTTTDLQMFTFLVVNRWALTISIWHHDSHQLHIKLNVTTYTTENTVSLKKATWLAQFHLDIFDFLREPQTQILSSPN